MNFSTQHIQPRRALLYGILLIFWVFSTTPNVFAQTGDSTKSANETSIPVNPAPIQAPMQLSPQQSAQDFFKQGMIFLEKQQFRQAADAFRSASNLEPVNTTFLHHYVKTLFYAEFKNRDSVRLARDLMNLYNSLGKETSNVQALKAQILANDINTRLEALLQDSLKIAQKYAAKVLYDYSYKATLAKPNQVRMIDSSLGGASELRISVTISAGAMKQQNNLLDKWASGGFAVRFGTWSKASETLDLGWDAGLNFHVGGLLDQATMPSAADSLRFLKRVYEAGFTARFRLTASGGTVFGLLGAAHAENVQTLAVSDANAWRPLRPYIVAGGGLFIEPRLGKSGFVAEARFYPLTIPPTLQGSQMITASLGYAFGSADLLVEGAYTVRPESAPVTTVEMPAGTVQPTTLYARISLRWHVGQALTLSNRELTQEGR